MPGGDRTGPLGNGPLTGRGAGFCRGFGIPGFFSRWTGGRRGGGRGFGFGGGGYGRGWRNRFFATGVPGWASGRENAEPFYPATGRATSSGTWEKSYLEEQAQLLRSELADIDERLAELKVERKTK